MRSVLEIDEKFQMFCVKVLGECWECMKNKPDIIASAAHVIEEVDSAYDFCHSFLSRPK
ncbi:MAG: hypothetical protein NVS2B12_18490 [Ktedonobacteraceae bacterium]